MSARPFTFWRVLPLPGEPVNSYFSRLVMDEAAYLPKKYASEIGINAIFKSDEVLERIFRLPISEQDKERLRWWTPVELNGSIRLAGHVFTRNQFRWARRLQCRDCVAASPYHRVWWQLECFRTCPVHQCALEPIAFERNTIGRWWPRFDRVVQERVAIVDLGDAADTFESYVIQSLLDPSRQASPRALSDFIECAQFAGRLLGNDRSLSVPPFSAKDWEVGYQALKGELSLFKYHFRTWLHQNAPSWNVYQMRDLVGWADEYLTDEAGPFDPELDDLPSPMHVEVSAIIRAECGRALGR